MNCVLTIITPTYNRKDLLRRLAESLNQQTKKNFQWLIIDDGSTDGTGDTIADLACEGFKMEYFRKENGGKHTALNYAHEHIEGEYVCIVDSDDTMIPEAVEIIEEAIQTYGNDPRIGCLSFLKGEKEGEPLADFPAEVTVANHIDFRVNCNRAGDCFEIVRTDLFKKYPFPVFEGERFMSEGFLWVSLALECDTVYLKKQIYMCTYLDGGLTKSGRAMRLRCPLGGMANSNNYLRAKLNFKNTVHEALLYIVYGKFAGFTRKSIVRKSNRKAATVLLYPCGWALFKVWKHRYAL